MVQQLRVHMKWNTEFIRDRRLWNTKTLILLASSAPAYDSVVIEEHLCTIQLAAERQPPKAERGKLESGKPAPKVTSRLEVSKEGIAAKVKATLVSADAVSASASAPASIEGNVKRLQEKMVNVERDMQEMKFSIQDQGRRLDAIDVMMGLILTTKVETPMLSWIR